MYHTQTGMTKIKILNGFTDDGEENQLNDYDNCYYYNYNYKLKDG